MASIPRRRVVMVVSLIALVGIVSGIFGWQRVRGARDNQALQARFQEVNPHIGEITESISALGNLEPYLRVEVKPEVDGKVERIFVKQGELVKKGQRIVKIDPGDLPVILKQAEAGVLSARAKLNKLLAGPDASDVAQMETSYEQARISLDDAKKQLARDEALFHNGAISEQQFQDSRSRVKLAEQQFIAAKEKLDSARSGPKKEDVEVARAELAQAEANLASIKRQMDSLTVVAPIDGTITDVAVQEGDVVKQGATLVTLADLTKMKAVIPVNEIDMPKIVPGQQVAITLDALPGQRFHGKVSSVGYEGQIRDNIVTYEVTADIPNPDGKLRGGMTADVTVILQSKKNVLVLPVDALQERYGRTIVLVAGQDGPVPRSVKVGLRNDSFVEIVDGLSEEDRVLIRETAQQMTPSGYSDTRAPFRSSSDTRVPSGNQFRINMGVPRH